MSHHISFIDFQIQRIYDGSLGANVLVVDGLAIVALKAIWGDNAVVVCILFTYTCLKKTPQEKVWRAQIAESSAE